MSGKGKPGIASKAATLSLDIANGRHLLSRFIPACLFLFDAMLCALVIWKIPYTEIDWRAYMEQIAQYVSGERDYTIIKGGTGPLVYPAAHVYTYTALYHLTDEGRNILLAQQIFAALYLATLGLVMACYWKAKVPPYVFPLLVLSKRLHSIFMLRCFNDCFATFFLWLAIFLFQRRAWTAGSIAYSWGLGIKMSLLLVIPAVGVVLLLGRGFSGSLRCATIIAQIQILIANKFLRRNAWGYLGRAFEFSRQFLFKWTVNWRFVGEEMFLSRSFSLGLLVMHALVLTGFIAGKWLKPAGKSISAILLPILGLSSPFSPSEETQIASRVTPEYVMTTILSANAIGLLFARSLHYQFYSYLAWATPYLLWRSRIHPVFQYGIWALQEWAWNVFPSTPVSSGVVVGVLATTVALVAIRDHGGGERDVPSSAPERKDA
ncbi:glycosyltransferase family 58 protein [Durotheca rogersii]|uniref:glycosyltransferase family 58 protein n=1 Tax=Durotheca rogersii TaxID=419775 RepID=UPI00221FC8D7|nr:glycosyltransferase family 58 protein [Durotheca rogersii]KAI5868291.1 glycosyltransferase family 58 protein [Durotheca rogersii]